MDTRRKFLTGLLVVAAMSSFRAPVESAQTPSSTGANKALGAARDNRSSQDPGPQTGVPPVADKQAQDENEKEIRKKVEQLYALATDLKVEVDKTDLNKVFPATVVKKAQAIEKLAKDIKSRSKG
jgi:hypothetical protein